MASQGATSEDPDASLAAEERQRNMDSKTTNPFKMPSDEEIFSLRDEERARKEEVGPCIQLSPFILKRKFMAKIGVLIPCYCDVVLAYVYTDFV